MDKMMEPQERVQQIIRHDTRVATDLKHRDKSVKLNKDFYNVEATKEENAFIDEVLDTNAYMGSIEESDKLELEMIRSRNDSHILVNDHKWYGGDSDLMHDVKDSITALEKSLAETDINPKTIGLTKQKYKDAITACKNYIEGKNPWFSTGKRRKKEVEERLKKLQEEQEQFEWGISAVERNVAVNHEYPTVMLTFLTIGHEQINKSEEYGARYKKNFEEQFQFAQDATSEFLQKTNGTKEDGDFKIEDKELSPGAQEFFEQFYKSMDIVESIMTNENMDRWAGYEGIKGDKNLFMNEGLANDVEATSKLLESDTGTYFSNNEVLDWLYEKYEKECRASDTLSFALGLMSTKKLEIQDQAVRKEVSDRLDYYYGLSDRLLKSASLHQRVIKCIMEKKPIEKKFIEHTDMEDNLTLREKAGMV